MVATASCKRAPFDLAEAESELVGGFHTEYSGMRWSFFFMGEYASMFAVCGVASVLFLGGWNTGIEQLDAQLYALRSSAADGTGSWAGGYLANVVGALVFATKASLGVFVQVWLRWTLPRLRIDQVMTTCLKYLVPISCFLFLGATIWPLALQSRLSRTTWAQPVGEGLSSTVKELRAERESLNRAVMPESAPQEQSAPQPSEGEKADSASASSSGSPDVASKESQKEVSAMNGPALLFYFFVLLTVLSAIAVVISQTVVRMAFWLVISLGSTAALFFLADADFVGCRSTADLCRCTLVLLVFGVMLTASGPYLKIETSPGETIIASLIGLLFLAIVYGSVQGVDWSSTPANSCQSHTGENRSGAEGQTLRPLGLSLLGCGQIRIWARIRMGNS